MTLRVVHVALALTALGYRSFASAEHTLVVEEFTGRRAASFRSAVVQGLSGADEVEIVELAELNREFENLGLDRTADTNYVEAARRLQITAYVSGSVERTRNRWQVTVRIRNAATGTVISEQTFRARRVPRLRRAIEHRISSRLYDVLEMTASPAVYSEEIQALDSETPPASPIALEESREPTPPPAPDLDPELLGEPQESEEASPTVAMRDGASSPDDRTTHALELTTQVRLFHREMHYLADEAGLARNYILPLGPQLAASAAWFPAHPFRRNALAHIGVTAEAAHSFALASQGPDGTDYRTADKMWRVGLVGRLPLGRHSLAVTAGYGAHTFDVSRANLGDPLPLVPPVTYRGAHFGAEGRLRFKRFSMRVQGGYALVLGTGKINTASFFPGTTARGFDVLLEGGYPLAHGLEVLAAIDGRLYKLDFDIPTGTLGPGGASDRYIGFSLGIAWRPV